MGTVFKRGQRWGISYIDPHGRQIRKMVSPFKETAQRIVRKIETDIVEGKYLDIKKSKKIFFEDFAQEYLENYVKLQNKAVKPQSGKVNLITVHFKGKTLQEIDSLMIRKFLSLRGESITPCSLNKDLTMLKCMFNRAIDWGYLTENPTRGIKKLPENNERCRWLAEEEQNHLLSFCKGLTRTLVIVALRTGMRWGEIAHLKWKQSPNSNYVDFGNNVIFIHESMAKSNKSRFIPLSQVMKSELLKLPHQDGSDYIFLNPDTNKPLGSIKKAFKTAVKKAGLKDFRFHDLRHTFASQLVRNSVDIYVVQKLLGHATPKLTQRYAHLRPEMLKDAIDKIDVQFEGSLYNTPSCDSTNLAHLGKSGKTQLSVV